MRSLLAILLLLSSGVGWELRAQDLTGQWTGTATDEGSDRKQKLVLTITESDSAFGGVLHWYFPETQYIRHLLINGRFYGKDSVLTIREDSSADIGEPGGKPVTGRNPADGFHVLYYRRTAGHRDILEGHWRSSGDRLTGTAGRLTIRLEKKAPPFLPLPVVTPVHNKKDSVQLKTLQDRQSTVAATIPVRGTDTLRIELYDNGEIDGDSVSLYVNNELLLQHLKLTAEAMVLLVPVDKSLPVNKLVLFAENLGRLPPNTALMEVTVHGKTYNLFLSTDYKRNASVEFILQE